MKILFAVLIAAAALGVSAHSAWERCRYCTFIASYALTHPPEDTKEMLANHCEEDFQGLCNRTRSSLQEIKRMAKICGADYACKYVLDECPDAVCNPRFSHKGRDAREGEDGEDGVTCDLCKTIVSKARDALKRGASLDGIINTVCRGTLVAQPACKAILNLGAKALTNYLLKYTDDNFVCAKLHLC